MSSQRTVTAIDIGTDVCVTLIGSISESLGKPQILGVGVVPSRGMRKSQIIDLDEVLQTLTKSVEQAERMAGVEVREAYVALSGIHISSQNSTGVVAVANPESEITAQDIERVIEAARAISLPSDREIVHVVPKDFSVDSQEGIRDPLGMTGVRLESEAHIITGLSTFIRNIEKCVMDLGIQVSKFVFSGLASSRVVVTETEKELGVAVVDIGAGSTNMCVYVDGSLEYSGALPVGARHITLDIAHGCRVSFDTAEKIKLSLSEHNPEELTPYPGESKPDFNRRKKQADQIKLHDLSDTPTDESISRKMVVERILLPRVSEMIDLVKKKLVDEGLLDKIRAGVVLTGGGAQTTQLALAFKKELKCSARIGAPEDIQGLASNIMTPAFATSIGLILLGLEGEDEPAQADHSLFASISGSAIGGVRERLTQLLKNVLP